MGLEVATSIFFKQVGKQCCGFGTFSGSRLIGPNKDPARRKGQQIKILFLIFSLKILTYSVKYKMADSW